VFVLIHTYLISISLLLYIVGTDSVDYQQKLVNAGACEAVTKALLKYSEYESIAHACFRSLVVLLMNNGAYKSKLGALGVCGCVVEAMHMFPYSAQVGVFMMFMMCIILVILLFCEDDKACFE